MNSSRRILWALVLTATACGGATNDGNDNGGIGGGAGNAGAATTGGAAGTAATTGGAAGAAVTTGGAAGAAANTSGAGVGSIDAGGGPGTGGAAGAAISGAAGTGGSTALDDGGTCAAKDCPAAVAQICPDWSKAPPTVCTRNALGTCEWNFAPCVPPTFPHDPSCSETDAGSPGDYNAHLVNGSSPACPVCSPYSKKFNPVCSDATLVCDYVGANVATRCACVRVPPDGGASLPEAGSNEFKFWCAS
jgi:hypothetical protein